MFNLPFSLLFTTIHACAINDDERWTNKQLLSCEKRLCDKGMNWTQGIETSEGISIYHDPPGSISTHQSACPFYSN